MLRKLLMLLTTLVLATPWAAAHEMSMAEMVLRETSPGEFIWQWSAANDKRPMNADLVPRWPDGCVAQESALHCRGGLSGTLRIDGVGDRYSAALVRIFWIDGEERVYTLTGSQSHVELYGSSQDRRSWYQIAVAYVVLGVEHILSGYDHLLFVCGLLFLVSFRRQLLWTITAFTAAHSLTLVSAALGWLTLRPPPVEAGIALSIVLVAAEALHQRPTLSRRWPALVAFLFGLVHGLGFAGALKEIGLPQNYLPTALFSFNVGVELGQLLVVAVAWLLWRALRQWKPLPILKNPALYGIGSIAAYWCLVRVAVILR
ncbi:MAG: HupE/UreJ family protein [Steroidobacteraceae bacterium]